MSINPEKLLLSSDFYSIQGEGISTGVPSYFVRLGICNLTCGISRQRMKQIVDNKEFEDGEIFVGDLQEQGKASWTCDSISQWAYRGEDKDFQFLFDRWKEQDILEQVKSGNIHIIWTGGEPTIPKHQESIVNFTKYSIETNQFSGNIGKLGKWVDGEYVTEESIYLDSSDRPFYEIETNGTFYISDPLFGLLDQINCSPKLENSGMTKKQRLKPDAIERIMQHPNYQFKFVISTEEDVEEVFRDFVVPFDIPIKNVICMPGLDKQEDFHERTNFILEMAKKYGFRGLTRLHISAYDQTLNV